MARYDPLKRFLSQQTVDSVTMTFDDVERIIGAKLPSSALEGNAWWSNNPTNHAQAAAWLGAGFETANIDRLTRKLTFRRRKAAPEPAGPVQPVDCHPAVGALQGVLWIDPAFDLCQPVLRSRSS